MPETKDWVSHEGVAKLLMSNTDALVPAGSERENRRKKCPVSRESKDSKKGNYKKIGPVQIPFSFLKKANVVNK